MKNIKPRLVDDRLLQVFKPKSISSTLSSLSLKNSLKLSNIKIESPKISKNVKYFFSNFIGLFILLLCVIVLYNWHKQFSYNRFLLQNIHLTEPGAYEPIKPYDFMTKHFA